MDPASVRDPSLFAAILVCTLRIQAGELDDLVFGLAPHGPWPWVAEDPTLANLLRSEIAVAIKNLALFQGQLDEAFLKLAASHVPGNGNG